MARITIVGSGVIGMATAAALSRAHDVTIVARDLPGDDPTIDWASLWAGACFRFGGTSGPAEMRMQLDAFMELSRWCDQYPESSVKRITIDDIFEEDEDMWWRNHVSEFRTLSSAEIPKGAKSGISYTTLILQPLVFIPWLRKKLESEGVKFKRMNLTALSDVRSLGHDVLINATGLGAKSLADVKDSDVLPIRGQTMLIKTDYPKLFMHDHGEEYTYVIPHLNGTAIVGGCRQPDETSAKVSQHMCQHIVKKLNQNLPDHFSSNLNDYQILRHNVGLRPSRKTGIRVEKGIINGQKVVHVYGFAGGGYIHSFGAARMASKLVDEFLFPDVKAKL